MMRSKLSVFVCIVALLGLTACSDDDEVINIPVSQQAAAALEGVFIEVVEPLADFVEGMAETVINAQPKGPSLVCPGVAGACTSGSVTCDADSSGAGLEFVFDDCHVPDAGVVADGTIIIVPTGSYAFAIELVNFSLDGGDSMNGPMNYDLPACFQGWYIDATSAFLASSIKACDEEYPSSQSTLTISVFAAPNIWIYYFTFDGSSLADVVVELNGELVSTCEVDLDTYDATCVDAEPI